jgi:hypothetical protein
VGIVRRWLAHLTSLRICVGIQSAKKRVSPTVLSFVVVAVVYLISNMFVLFYFTIYRSINQLVVVAV